MTKSSGSSSRMSMSGIAEMHRAKWMGGGQQFFPMSQYSGKSGGAFQSGITDKKLIDMFLRDEMAYRIVRDFAVDPLKKGFSVQAAEDDGGKFKEECSKIFSSVDMTKKLGSARVLSRLAGFSLLLLGTEDSAPSDRPPENVRRLAFIKPVSKWNVRAMTQDTNPLSPTFGEIISYDIASTLQGGLTDTKTVSASRVIHITNDEFDSDPRGVSTLFPLFDIQNIKKETDAALGESAVRNAEPWRVVTLPPDADEAEAQAVEDELYGGRRNIFIQPGTGNDQTDYKWKQLPPNSINPKDWVDWINTRVAGGSGMPKTMLEGATPGSVTGSWVSQADYWKKCGEMQEMDITPIIGELVRRLQGWGLLEEKDFEVCWPTLWELDDKELAAVANLQANAFAKVIAAAKDLFVLPKAEELITWGIDQQGFYLEYGKDAGRYYPIANLSKNGMKVQTGAIKQKKIAKITPQNERIREEHAGGKTHV
jgi:hypothetical protein